MTKSRKPRVLVFIVAYNAEKTISSVVRRIPVELAESYEVEVLIIDDASGDSTFAQGHQAGKSAYTPFPVHVLFNPVNQGYGGNQKLGYQYAIDQGFDFVALLHGDGQYAPECLPMLLEPLRKGAASAVFGSRMLKPVDALKGGMPLYKFAGNRILTWIENKLLRSRLSEFHSGYRIYSVRALQAIPFDRNSNDFHFDTEIIIQLLIANLAIRELPIPTYYGDEVCHVNGLKYALNVVAASLKARLQELSLFYDRRFDCAPGGHAPAPGVRLRFASPYTAVEERIRKESRVLDLSCAAWDAGCKVPDIRPGEYEAVLMLDAIEHLPSPETVLERLREALASGPSTDLMISTGNVACFITRVMLLLGQFNYGKRGILDLTHTRLFTFGSLRRALEQSGFSVVEAQGIPAPFPLAIGFNAFSRALLALNQILIRLCPGVFAYQIFMRAKARPTLKSLLDSAQRQSRIRADVIEALGTDDRLAFEFALRRQGFPASECAKVVAG